MNRSPIKHPKRRLLERIDAMPVPGVLDLSGAEWIPSDKWLREVPRADLSVRRPQAGKLFVFRVG